MLSPRCQEGSGPVRLLLFINAGNLQGLAAESAGPDLAAGESALAALREAGFHGLQGVPDALVEACHRLGLKTAASGRIDHPREALPQAQRWRDSGHACATLHVGTGMEDDSLADRLGRRSSRPPNAPAFRSSLKPIGRPSPRTSGGRCNWPGACRDCA
jgi:hypothetical protein